MNIALELRKKDLAKNICQICCKTINMGYNKPHSLHRTKKIIRPNIQKIKGQFICTRCLRTKAKRLSS